MENLIIKQVDAFTTKPFCGNPVGVITEADGLTEETMQNIASEMNLSETAFVTLPESENAIFMLRFFTPTEEVDLSGHAIIAACYALIEDGRIEPYDGITSVLLDTKIGSVALDIHFRKPDQYHSMSNGGADVAVDGRSIGMLEKIMMHQSIKEYRQSDIPVKDIAAIFGIDDSDILRTGLPIEIISTGLSQLMVPVMHKEIIRNMHPDMIKLGLMNGKNGIDTNHVFTIDTYDPGSVSYARHFAPALGMWEDPATGTAAAGLGTYLSRHGVITSTSLVMEQGIDRDNLARILVEIEEGEQESIKVLVGGLAVTSIKRNVNIEEGRLVIA